MHAVSTRFDEGDISDIRRLLETFVYLTPFVTFAMLTSGDGSEIAAHPADPSLKQRLATSSGSLRDLCETMARDAGMRDAHNLVVQSEVGTIVVVALGKSLRHLSLTVVASGEEMIADLLWAARECCAVIEGRFSTVSH